MSKHASLMDKIDDQNMGNNPIINSESLEVDKETEKFLNFKSDLDTDYLQKFISETLSEDLIPLQTQNLHRLERKFAKDKALLNEVNLELLKKNSSRNEISPANTLEFLSALANS